MTDADLRERAALFDALSPTQLDALCNVAFGGHGRGLHPRTLESLERRGLIGRLTTEHRDGGFVWHLTRWEMPLNVHIDFCGWCATREGQPGDGSESSGG